MNKNVKCFLGILIIFISSLPFCLNLLGIDFGSTSFPLNLSASRSTITEEQQFYALTGALHHALLEWSAVLLAIIAGLGAFIHYYRHKDIAIPIIGLALLCAGLTDAFHTLAATRIILASVPSSDFIPFTWAFSRIFNASILILGVLLGLWLTRSARAGYSMVNADHDEKAAHKKIGQTQILIIISVVFIALVISAVILAATSQHLPQTTFKNAFITRPYDVVPLALFMLSAVLVWFWYQRKASNLKFALLLSLIPEVIAQLHMSFGSAALFDNHFNIAHFLKIVAYAVLTLGILMTLLQSSKILESKNENQRQGNMNRLLNTGVVAEQLLDVGKAKYSQMLVFSSFTFILAISVSGLVSSIYYIDAVKIAQQQQYQALITQGDFIEPMLKGVYQNSKNDLIFLSKTPPIQGMIRSLKKQDLTNYRLWHERLTVIFSQILPKDADYLQLSYITYPAKEELLKVYKSKQQIFTANNEQLNKVAENLFFDDKDLQQDKVLFFNDSVQTKGTLNATPLLRLFIPIYDEKSGDISALLTLQVKFYAYIHRLKLGQLSGNKLFFADPQGRIIYQVSPLQGDGLASSQTPLTLQQQFPQLADDIARDKAKSQFGMQGDFVGKTNVKGHYRTINLLSEGDGNVIQLFILMDQQALLTEIATVRNRSLLIGFGLAIVALAIALLLSWRLSNALQLITTQLIQYSRTGEMNNLPIKAQDESGVLARSFHNLFLTQAAQDKALLQQKWALDEHAIVSITDIKGNITYINNKFTKISGYSEMELFGNNHRILNSGHHNKNFFTQMYNKIYHGQTWHGDICNRAKDGRLYWVNTTIVPFMNNQGHPESYISIRTDITNNKQLLAAKIELSKQVAKLARANVELNQFAYVASHDLKSPLNGISQLVSWLEDDCYELLPEESKEHLALLKNRSKRMIALLNDLLNYSRVGRTEYQVETLNLAVVVDDIFDLHGHLDGFSCIAPNIEITVQRVPFELVIRNLISNALKHHDKNEGRIDISIKKDEEADQCYYIIYVQDDGPGIPVHLHEKALEMFQTLQSRDKTEGSGMGLALVKKTVQNQGGTINIAPSDDRGTLIIIKWPYTKIK